MLAAFDAYGTELAGVALGGAVGATALVRRKLRLRAEEKRLRSDRNATPADVSAFYGAERDPADGGKGLWDFAVELGAAALLFMLSLSGLQEVALCIALGYLAARTCLCLWRYLNHPDPPPLPGFPAVEVPQEAVVGFGLAVLIVATMLGLAYWLI